MLAFVVAADAPIDVLVLEVGMGGEWDSTNTADGDVAVFTPIDVDHVDRLGATIAEIATVKSGIIKPGAAVVSAAQPDEALRAIRSRAEKEGAHVAVAGDGFALEAQTLAVGGQQLDIRGVAGTYREVYLPLYGAHQGTNAALAVAAVESLIGGGSQPLAADVVADGLGNATSPGRLQLVGTAPTVLVDAAHNPHGARALVAALDEAFDIDEWGAVVGILDGKDAVGIMSALVPAVARVFATAPDSDRATDPDVIADVAEAADLPVTVHPTLEDAADAARAWAAESDRRAVVIAGSVVLAGEALRLSELEDWKSGWQA